MSGAAASDEHGHGQSGTSVAAPSAGKVEGAAGGAPGAAAVAPAAVQRKIGAPYTMDWDGEGAGTQSHHQQQQQVEPQPAAKRQRLSSSQISLPSVSGTSTAPTVSASYLANTREYSRELTTGLVYDGRMLLHDIPGPISHPEAPERIEAIYRLLQRSGCTLRMKRIPIREATKQENLARRTPLLEAVSSLYVNGYSALCTHLACGSIIELCDAIVSRRIKHGFVVIRPPGHHAEPNHSMGFCFHNNVAVAIRSLRERYPDGPNAVERVLILDWDANYGNGTHTATANDESYFSPFSATTSASSLRAPSCTGAGAGGAGVGTTTTASVRETRSRTRLALQSSMNRPLSHTGGASASASMGTGSGAGKALAAPASTTRSTSSATVPGLGVGVGVDVSVGRVKAQAEALESSAQPQTLQHQSSTATLRSVDGGSGSPTEGGVARPAPPERQDSTSSVVSSTGSCAAASSKTRAAAKKLPASKISCFEVEDTEGIKVRVGLPPHSAAAAASGGRVERELYTSLLSVVDLAGLERASNTGLMSGERLKEAGNINKSLMCLGQCLETIRKNQERMASLIPAPVSMAELPKTPSMMGTTVAVAMTMTPKRQLAVVPFRYSKLTQLFQSFFPGPDGAGASAGSGGGGSSGGGGRHPTARARRSRDPPAGACEVGRCLVDGRRVGLDLLFLCEQYDGQVGARGRGRRREPGNPGRSASASTSTTITPSGGAGGSMTLPQHDTETPTPDIGDEDDVDAEDYQEILNEVRPQEASARHPDGTVQTDGPTSNRDKVAADPVARQHPSVGPRQDEPGRQVSSLPDTADAMLSWAMYEARHGVVDVALPTLLSLALQSSRQKDMYSGRVDPKLSRTGAQYLERLERKIDALLLYVWDNCIRACPGPSAASSSALASQYSQRDVFSLPPRADYSLSSSSSRSPISNGFVSTRPAPSITGGPQIGAGPDVVLVGHGPGCASVLRLISRRALHLSQTLAKQQLAQSSEQMKTPIVRAVVQSYGHEDLAQVPKHVPPASTGSVGTSAGKAVGTAVSGAILRRRVRLRWLRLPRLRGWHRQRRWCRMRACQAGLGCVLRRNVWNLPTTAAVQTLPKQGPCIDSGTIPTTPERVPGGFPPTGAATMTPRRRWQQLGRQGRRLACR
ncbi:Histone deacetylase hda1 [Tilletia horrida]|nr:Histone deacetylase hda1 [Tilletia horrida]